MTFTKLRVSLIKFFDVSIERSVSGEAGSVVDFNEVGSQLMVEHDIEAKDFKAHVIAEVVRVHIGD